jgi:hypothetical protein
VGRSVGDDRFRFAVSVSLLAIPFLNAVVFLAHGAGFVLDDWFTLRNGHFDGAWAAAGDAQAAARPGSYPVDALVFGLFGQHPLPGILLLAAVNGTTAVLTFRLLSRFFPRGSAAAVALLWVVLPTHTSTELWLSCTVIAVSQLALSAGLLLAINEDRRAAHLVLSWLLLAAAVVTYEASLPLAALGAVVLTSRVRPVVDLPFLIGAGASLGASAAWILTHWNTGKSVHPMIDPIRLVQVNFGWGITPDGGASPLATPLVLLALVGVSVAVVRSTLSSVEAGSGEWLVVWGIAVMVVGVLPFLRYFYEPQGAGDRANYLSSVGGALVWTGLVAMVARVDRRAGALALVALVAIALPARLERIRVWSTAGTDSTAIADLVVEQVPHPDGVVVVGPAPIVRWNVASYIDDSNLQGALSIAYGIPHAPVRLSYDRADWERVDPHLRVDASTVAELDDLAAPGG